MKKITNPVATLATGAVLTVLPVAAGIAVAKKVYEHTDNLATTMAAGIGTVLAGNSLANVTMMIFFGEENPEKEEPTN